MPIQNYNLFCEDNLKILKTIESNAIDSLVTDPPAGIGFTGLEWDSDRGARDNWVKWLTKVMTECYRVLKPGAYGVVWALPRTSHWTAYALENAGFEIKDVINHVFGSGFPKSRDIKKEFQKNKYINTDELYRATEWIRKRRDEIGLTNKELDQISGVRGGACHWTATRENGQPSLPTFDRWQKLKKILEPIPSWLQEMIKPENLNGASASDRIWVQSSREKHIRTKLSKKWRGWGTGLKPAHEHWIIIQKPISEHNIAANIFKHGVGAINIDDARIRHGDHIKKTKSPDFKANAFFSFKEKIPRSEKMWEPNSLGRFPSNFLMTESNAEDCAVKRIKSAADEVSDPSNFFKTFKEERPGPFFYCVKPSKKEKCRFNNHPTVKPIRLMRYLIKLITPHGGVVLDPFMGSGSTGVATLFENNRFIGIEKEPQYFEISCKRLSGVTIKPNSKEVSNG